jgi:hypothetical protein
MMMSPKRPVASLDRRILPAARKGEAMPSMRDRRGDWRAITLSILTLVTISGIALEGMAARRGQLPGLLGTRGAEPRREPTLAERVHAVDEAIVRGHVSGAIYQWRDAYGVALGTRRWDAMADMGDAASRIDRLGPAGAPRTTFRAEARQAYLLALFRARDASSGDGIERVADAFAALGDGEMAIRARAMAGALRLAGRPAREAQAALPSSRSD